MRVLPVATSLLTALTFYGAAVFISYQHSQLADSEQVATSGFDQPHEVILLDYEDGVFSAHYGFPAVADSGPPAPSIEDSDELAQRLYAAFAMGALANGVAPEVPFETDAIKRGRIRAVKRLQRTSGFGGNVTFAKAVEIISALDSAYAFFGINELNTAEAFARDALAHSKSKLLARHPEFALESASLLTRILLQKNEPEKARTEYLHVLDATRHTHVDDEARGESYRNLALLHLEAGDSSSALDLLDDLHAKAGVISNTNFAAPEKTLAIMQRAALLSKNHLVLDQISRATSGYIETPMGQAVRVALQTDAGVAPVVAPEIRKLQRFHSVKEWKSLSYREAIEYSAHSPSLRERKRVRSWVAASAPEGAEKSFALGSVASDIGDYSNSGSHYRQCIARDPNFLNCYNNLLFVDNPGRAEIDRAKAALFRNLDDPWATSLAANLAIEITGFSPDDADAFVKELSNKLRDNQRPMMDYVLGRLAQNRGDNKEAEERFMASVYGGSIFVDSYMRAFSLRSQRIGLANTVRDNRLLAEATEPLTIFNKYFPSRPHGILAQARWFSTLRLNNQASSADRLVAIVYALANRTYPTTEGVLGYSDAEYLQNRSSAIKVLEDGFAVLDFDPELLSQRAFYKRDRSENNPVGAEALYRQAMETAVSRTDSARYAVNFGRYLLETVQWRLDDARDLYEPFMDDLYTRNIVGAQLFYNRMLARDYVSAQEIISQLSNDGNKIEEWLRIQEMQLRRVGELKRRADAVGDDTAFYNAWRNIAKAPSLAFTFVGNDTRLTNTHKRLLDRIGPYIANASTKSYLYQLSPANAGSSVIEQTRYDEITDGIVAYLESKHGVDRNRIITSVNQGGGSGGVAPVSKTIVIELFPLGDASRPRISFRGIMPEQPLLASDGASRSIVEGYYPPRMRDIDTGLERFSLFRGGNAAFGYDGQSVLLASTFTESVSLRKSFDLFVFDTQSGANRFTQPLFNIESYEHGAIALSAHPTKPWVAFQQWGRIVYYDYEKGVVVRSTWLPLDRGYVRKFFWSKDGSRLYVGLNTADAVYELDGETLDLIKAYSGPAFLHSIALSHDGVYLLAADTYRNLHRWNLATSEYRVRNFPGLGLAGFLHPHPSLPLVIPQAPKETTDNTPVIDYESLTVVGTHRPMIRDFLIDDVSGEIVTSVLGSLSIEKRRLPSFEVTTDLSSSAPKPINYASDAEREYFLTHDSAGIHVWDVRTGARAHSWYGTFEHFQKMSGTESKFVAAMPGLLVEFDTDDFSIRKMSVDIPVQSITSNQNYLVIGGAPNPEGDVGVISLIDRATLNEVARYQAPIVTEILRFGKSYLASVFDLSISPDGNQIAFLTEWMDGFGHSIVKSRDLRIIDRSKDGTIVSHRQADEIFDAKADDDGSFYSYSGWRWRRLKDGLQQTMGVNFDPYAREYERNGEKLTTAILGEAEITIAATGKPTRYLVHDSNLIGYSVFPDRNILILYTRGNEIEFVDLQMLKTRITIVGLSDNNWLAYTPAAYFSGTQGAFEQSYLQIGRFSLPLTDVRKRFERPDILARVLTAVMEDNLSLLETGELARSATLPSQLFSPPFTLSPTAATSVTTENEDYIFEVLLTRKSKGAPLPNLIIKFNGRDFNEDLNEDGGYSGELSTVDARNGIYRYRRALALEFGNNFVQASLAQDEIIYSSVDAFIRLEGGARGAAQIAPASTIREKTGLWFFGVGVSDYESDSLTDLKYASKDARELADMLKRQEGRQYTKVTTTLYTDQEAVALTEKLRDFAIRVPSGDIMVVFLAGHGIQDELQNLYFAPHEGVADRFQTLLELDEIASILSERGDNIKLFLWLDICHAGAFNGVRANSAGLTAETAVKILEDGTGVSVFAASSGREPAIESPHFRNGHGAFTASLLYGLEGHADENKNEEIYLYELNSYVERKVQQLTNCRQHPVIPIAAFLRDGPFAAYDSATDSLAEDGKIGNALNCLSQRSSAQ